MSLSSRAPTTAPTSKPRSPRCRSSTSKATTSPSLPDEAPRPQFVYHDLSAFLCRLKKVRGLNQWYYLLWQRRASKLVRRLVAEKKFDLLHHVTYASYRYRTALDRHGVPVLWGPVGGAERIPWRLLRLDSKWSFFREATRNLINAVQQVPFLGLMPRSAKSECVLASTEETRQKLKAHRVDAPVVPTIGIDLPESIPEARERHDRRAPLKIVYVGNLLFLKGVHLALKGLAAAEFPFHLTIVGDGIYGDNLRRFVRRSGLGDRVTFAGRVPMAQVPKFLADAEVFLFPSLHDSGGMELIEAMAAGLPPVCLDCGGPGVAVDDTCGFAVPVSNSASTAKALADALSQYHEHPDLYRSHSAAAIRRVRDQYGWRQKGEQMAEIYRSCAGASR